MPELTSPYYNRGHIYRELGQIDKALADFHSFLERIPAGHFSIPEVKKIVADLESRK